MVLALSSLAFRPQIFANVCLRFSQKSIRVPSQSRGKMVSAVKLSRDPNTLSNYNDFLTTHITVNFKIDFEKKTVGGNVALTLKSITNAAVKEILLDTSFLSVKGVLLDGKSPKWGVLPRTEPFGSVLRIDLEDGIQNGNIVQLEMKTETTKECTAIQWLTPAQTRSQHPYVFTQCQAIHARSVFPCQDTPNVKATVTFNIESPLPVIASGIATCVKDIDKNAHGVTSSKLYTFEQTIPIPSYLFALASGDIAKAPIGPRSVVATGPKQLKAAQWELEESTERYIETVEEIVFPYQWTEYNVLVLPPSFPYGGMENPVYTYATPTMISGDRENVDVIAHELSHSYSGNLVSNASWEHFWLNEGWTTYLERRLQAAVHGEPYRDFSAIIGWKALQDSVKQFGDSHEFTQMVVDLKGKDPDDAFSSIPYEKGYTFLSHLEAEVTKDKWNEYIPHYFTTFARQSLDSYDFKANLLSFFASDPTASKALNDVDWDSWFYSPGLPPKPKFDTSLVDVCYDLASKWETNNFAAKEEDIRGWSANQVVVFLDTVLESAKALDKRASQMMGSTYGFSKSQNVEIVSRYYQAALKANDEAVYKPTTELLANVGRMKFVRPLYRLLNQADRTLAVETFQKNKDFYHPICKSLVEKDLFGKGG